MSVWNALTTKIGPHLDLSDNQKRVIEHDYSMVDGRLSCSARAALLAYWLLAMLIGKDALKREALIQQIVLLNREQLLDYLGFGSY